MESRQEAFLRLVHNSSILLVTLSISRKACALSKLLIMEAVGRTMRQSRGGVDPLG